MLQRGRLRVFFGCPAKLICMFLLEIACVLHAWFPGILWMKATLLLAPLDLFCIFAKVQRFVRLKNIRHVRESFDIYYFKKLEILLMIEKKNIPPAVSCNLVAIFFLFKSMPCA